MTLTKQLAMVVCVALHSWSSPSGNYLLAVHFLIDINHRVVHVVEADQIQCLKHNFFQRRGYLWPLALTLSRWRHWPSVRFAHGSFVVQSMRIDPVDDGGTSCGMIKGFHRQTNFNEFGVWIPFFLYVVSSTFLCRETCRRPVGVSVSGLATGNWRPKHFPYS